LLEDFPLLARFVDVFELLHVLPREFGVGLLVNNFGLNVFDHGELAVDALVDLLANQLDDLVGGPGDELELLVDVERVFVLLLHLEDLEQGVFGVFHVGYVDHDAGLVLDVGRYVGLAQGLARAGGGVFLVDILEQVAQLLAVARGRLLWILHDFSFFRQTAPEVVVYLFIFFKIYGNTRSLFF